MRVVDAHNDLLLLVDRRPPAEQADYFRERWLPQLRAGGVCVQVLPVFAADHVGFGPDFIQEFADETVVGDLVLDGVSLKQVIPHLGGPAGLSLVLDSLAARGVSDADVRKVAGDNWLRVFRAELGRPKA